MPHSQWVYELRVEMLNRGLPTRYVNRTSGEFVDHMTDLSETQSLERSRLGDPEELAKALAVSYRSRTFDGRNPITSIVLAFIGFFLLAVPLYYIVFVIIPINFLMQVCDQDFLDGFAMTPFVWWLLRIVRFAGAIVPFGTVMWLAIRWVERIGRGLWPCAVVLALNLVVAFTWGVSFEYPDDRSGTPDVNVEVEIGLSHFLGQDVALSSLQIATPLGLIVAYLIREWVVRRKLLSDSPLFSQVDGSKANNVRMTSSPSK